MFGIWIPRFLGEREDREDANFLHTEPQTTSVFWPLPQISKHAGLASSIDRYSCNLLASCPLASL